MWSQAAYPGRRGDTQFHSSVDLLVGLLPNAVNIALQFGGLLSQEARRKVLRSTFLVLQDGKCVGSGFFYAHGKAVTADHSLLPEQG